jgi:DNA polymerase-3 subunit alpha
MPHAPFVHLRVHSAYSLSEGALQLADIVKLCASQAMPAVAVTDTANMFGALEFSAAAKKAGLQPIVGTILNVTREDGNDATRGRATDQLVLLVQNETGYRNLIKLSSLSYRNAVGGLAPQVGARELGAHADGLIALTGSVGGEVGRAIRDGREGAADEALRRLAALYPGRLYVELQRHGLTEEARIEGPLIELAYKLDLPLVATNDVYFSDGSMYEAHDALLCIADGAYVDQAERRRMTPDHRFKSAAEMQALFADLPPEAIANTLAIAQRCAYAAPERAPILPQFSGAHGGGEAEEMAVRARAGLEARLAGVLTPAADPAARAALAKPYRDKLEFELDVIAKMGFAGYFLIVADFIQYAKDHDIPVGPGRGSGAGSVVAWSLRITDLDPLQFGLVFERFLNPERVSMPDFDIDFCQDKRDRVIEYVQERYGSDRVAQIITFGKLQARAAVRDVGRVLQMPYGQVDRLSKMVPFNPANPIKLKDAIAAEPRLQQERDADPKVAKLLEIAIKLEGLYRHASTHAAGVVIGDRPLDELVPMYRDPRSEMPVTQFSMKYAEAAGLVKFDFLGLKTLTVLDQAAKLIAKRGPDHAIDYARLRLDDKKTYDLMTAGDTIGVFQFESPGMQSLLREAKPSGIEDLIALVALFRPGPMENIPKYVASKHGREKPEFLHELIEPVVKDTYGVIIYQEQVMQIAQVFAGFTLGEADLLRRAMGKKIKSEMEAQRERFVKGAVAKGVPEDRAIYVFNLVDKFAGYGFNKAHSAGYALLAYHTAYLKAHYPVEFFAAMMTLDLSNVEKIAGFKRELDKVGIELRPPDINRSGVVFTVEHDPGGAPAIRYALAAVRNVGAQAMAAVIAEREANGPFKSIADFANRAEARALNKRQIENLAAAGAFDGLGEDRARVHAGAESIMRLAAAAAEDRVSKQVSLFGEAGSPAAHFVLPVAAAWRPMEKLTHEFEALGLFLSAHPLDAYKRELRRLGVLKIADVAARANGEARSYVVAGTVLGVQERRSAKGNRFARIQLSDTSGSFEVTAFSELLAQAGDLLTVGRSIVMTIEASTDGDFQRLTAQRVDSLEKMAADTETGLAVTVTDTRAVDPLARLLKDAGKGRGPVALMLKLADRATEVEIDLGRKFAVTPAVRERIAAVPGIAEIQEI